MSVNIFGSSCKSATTPGVNKKYVDSNWDASISLGCGIWLVKSLAVTYLCLQILCISVIPYQTPLAHYQILQ